MSEHTDIEIAKMVGVHRSSLYRGEFGAKFRGVRIQARQTNAPRHRASGRDARTGERYVTTRDEE